MAKAECQETKFELENVQEQQYYYNGDDLFDSEFECKLLLKKLNLNNDTHKVRKSKKNGKAGFYIENTEYGVPEEYRGYWKVRFHPISHPNDFPDVQLSPNGETMVFARDKIVTIPGRYREAADHTTYNKFTQVPNQPRKIASTIKTYNYDIIGKSTKAEFDKERREGNKVVAENIRRFGFNVTPEELPVNV